MIDAEANMQTELLEKTLAELSAALGMTIAICPGFKYGLRVSEGHGFRLQVMADKVKRPNGG